jgi:hypothetical protein
MRWIAPKSRGGDALPGRFNHGAVVDDQAKIMLCFGGFDGRQAIDAPMVMQLELVNDAAAR